MGPGPSFTETSAARRASIVAIDLEYVDLLSFHRPGNGLDSRKNLWLVLAKMFNEGQRVNNFGVRHYRETKEYARTPSASNQIKVRVSNRILKMVMCASMHPLCTASSLVPTKGRCQLL